MFRKLLMLAGVIVLLTGCQTYMKKKTHTLDTQTLPTLSPTTGSQTHIIKLKNGLTVLIKEDDRFPLVNARLMVHAGSAYETPKTAGISHLLEHMVFKGTDKREVGQSARDIESVAAA